MWLIFIDFHTWCEFYLVELRFTVGPVLGSLQRIIHLLAQGNQA